MTCVFQGKWKPCYVIPGSQASELSIKVGLFRILTFLFACGLDQVGSEGIDSKIWFAPVIYLAC